MTVRDGSTGRQQSCVSRNVLDVDGYERTVAGVRIEAVRTGKGKGPSKVLAIADEHVTLTSCEIGFPMRSRTTIGDDQILLAHVDEAPPGSQWCGIPLHTGALVSWGPAAEHAAVNLPGLKFTFVATKLDPLAAMADDAGVRLELPARGEVREVEASADTRWIGARFREVVKAADPGRAVLDIDAGTILHAMSLGFRQEGLLKCAPLGCGAIDSRQVVHLCIDYADATGRVPSIPELCLAANVSERRLRLAFTNQFCVPPSEFFRDWALTTAHKRLAAGGDTSATVTKIATDLGFGHLGRFATAYKGLYGQLPSTTLERSQRSSARPRRASTG